MRYGLTDRATLSMMAPHLSISSDKVQGEPYLRENSGVGDVIVTGGYEILSNPDIVLEAGFRFPTGNIDKTDALGTRINDILALGSGTTDPILGVTLYKTSVGRHGLDLFGSVRHRFTGGTNKWGYHFADETQATLGATYLIKNRIRVTPTFLGYSIGKDTWLGNIVPERGATVIRFTPEAAWQFSPESSAGFYYRIPVYRDLEGAQMAEKGTFGMTVTTSLSAIRRLGRSVMGDRGQSLESTHQEGEGR